MLKTKLIQIILGAVGSVAALLIQHFAGVGGDPMLTVAAGAATPAMFAGWS